MFVGTLRCDLLLHDIRSRKQRRSVVRPIVAAIGHKFDVAVADTGDQDLLRRAEVGVAVVSGEHAHCVAVLDAVERFVADRPEVDLLSARRRVVSDTDE